MRRGGRPGLIGLAARTAVITGTANAMGNRAHAQRQAADQQAQFQAAQQQAQIDAAAAEAVAAQQYAAPPRCARIGTRTRVRHRRRVAETRRAEGCRDPRRRRVRGCEGQTPRLIPPPRGDTRAAHRVNKMTPRDSS